MSIVRRPLIFVALVAALGLGCATSMTGRQQLLLFPESEMANMGRAAFTDMQGKTPRSSNSTKVTYVRCVANAVTQVVTPEQLRSVAVTRREMTLPTSAGSLKPMLATKL